MKKLLTLLAVLGLIVSASAYAQGNNLGLLVQNASSLDVEEQAAYDFATSRGFNIGIIDPAMITSTPSILDDYDGYWAANNSTPSGFDQATVSSALQAQLDGGKRLFATRYGRYLFQYVGLGTVHIGSSWYPDVSDHQYWVDKVADHAIFESMTPWLPPSGPPDDESQLLWYITPGYCPGDPYVSWSVTPTVLSYAHIWATYGWCGQSPNAALQEQYGITGSCQRGVYHSSFAEVALGDGSVLHGPPCLSGSDHWHYGAAGFQLLDGILTYVCSGGGQPPPPDGLVAYWALDEESGDNVADQSGHGLDGTASGATIIDGVRGKARSFDGNDFIEVPDNDLLDITDEITIMLWIKSDPITSQGFLISKRVHDGEMNYSLVLGQTVSGENSIRFEYGYGLHKGIGYDIVADVRDGEWHHVAFSLIFGDPSSAKCIIDGNPVAGYWRYGDGTLGGGTEIPNTNSYNLQMGRQLSTSPGYLKGGLDQVRIYNRALTESEVIEVYNSERGGSLQPDIYIADDDMSHDFGEVPVGSSEQWTFFISNIGDADLIISDLSITGAGANAYTLSISTPHTVSIGSSQSVAVTFTPIIANADYPAELNITSNDPEETDISIGLNGQGKTLAIKGSIVDFNTGSGIEGVTVYCADGGTGHTGGPGQYVISNNAGEFVFTNLYSGSYDVWPLDYGYTFQPPLLNISLAIGDVEIATFQGIFTQNQSEELLKNNWNAYKHDQVDLIDNGRVKSGGGPCLEFPCLLEWEDWTVSEAQSYLQLQSLWMNDQPTFDTAWEWTRLNLQQRSSDFLFSWLWHKNEGVVGEGSATDADIDIALSLALASMKQDWVNTSYYRERAIEIIRDIMDFNVSNKRIEVPGIYTHDGTLEPIWILTIGNEGGQYWDQATGELISVTFDPSYFSPHAYKIFAEFETDSARKERWHELVCDSYRLLSYLTRVPLPKPDYTTPPGYGVLPPYWISLKRHENENIFHITDNANRFGSLYEFDSFRTFWRISLDAVWNNDRNAMTYLEKTPFLMAKWIEGNFKSVYTHDGEYYLPNLNEWGPILDLVGNNYFDSYFSISPMCQFIMTGRQPFADDIFLNKIVNALEGDPESIFGKYYRGNWIRFGAMFYLDISSNNPFNSIDLYDQCGNCNQDVIEILAQCPVDLKIIIPNGTELTKNIGSSEYGDYQEIVFNENGSRVDYITLTHPSIGPYKIIVSCEQQVDENIHFNLYVRMNQDIFILTENETIPLSGNIEYIFNPLPFSFLTGFVLDSEKKGLCGISLDIYDSTGALWQSLVTDDSGYYHIDSIPNGDYTATVVTPLGYQADEETKEFTVNHVPVTVDFNLTELEITAQQRSRAYWAHHLHKALQNKPQDYTRAQFAQFTGLINVHFNQNQLNPVDFYSVPQPADQADSLAVLKKLLHMQNTGENEPLLKRLAKAQLMALILNVVSGKVHQTHEISADGRTVSQLITYCDMLVNDEIDPPDNNGCPGHGSPWFRYIYASFMLVKANLGLTVPAGMIPENVIQIAYKQHNEENLPTEFALHQNYPNPFNPTTEISFSLPAATHVKLEIFNIMGQKVATLVDDQLEAGMHIVQWDGSEAASGVYLYRLQADDFVDTKKMMLLK